MPIKLIPSKLIDSIGNVSRGVFRNVKEAGVHIFTSNFGLTYFLHFTIILIFFLFAFKRKGLAQGL